MRIPKINFFCLTVSALFLVCLSIFAFKGKYSDDVGTDAQVDRYYLYYIHVSTMIFVGFGFLMTFLSKYMFGAVGFNFLLSALCIVWGSLCVAIANNIGAHKGIFGDIIVDIPFLINSLFAAGAVMISFGAVLGKASPIQLVYMTIIELPFFAFAGYLIDHVYEAADLGGSMAIHAFGAYFGLTVSLFVSPKGAGNDHEHNKSIVLSDVTAMIGTIFLWILWPSFNAAVAATGGAAEGQLYRAVINTVLSLSASCLSAFIISSAVDGEGKFNIVHVQNATLAGGVAIGSSANLVVGPAGALLVGFLAGLISTFGYAYITPFLENKVGLRDTCGVHNLHGLPGILGGLTSVFVGIFKYKANSTIFTNGKASAFYQLVALLSTLFVAILGGLITGIILQKFLKPLDKKEMYHDKASWILEGEEGEEEPEQVYQHLSDDMHPTSYAPLDSGYSRP